MKSYPISSEKKEIDHENQDLIIKDLFNKMIEKDKSIKVFQATFSNYSKGYYQEGKKTNSLHEETIVAHMTLQKPLHVLLEVIDSPKDIAVGSRLLYTGGENVKVKAAGILGLISVNFSINDSMFSDTRNHKILSTVDGLTRITKPDTKYEMQGISEVNGKEVYMIRVDASEKLDPEITHEVIGVDTETFIVLLSEMYVGDDLVSQYMVKDIKTNIDLEDDFFNL